MDSQTRKACSELLSLYLLFAEKKSRRDLKEFRAMQPGYYSVSAHT
jgi:hypothetical protein